MASLVNWLVSILYSAQSTVTHTYFLPGFGRHDTNSVMNGLGLQEGLLNSTFCNIQEWYMICLI